MSFFNDDDDDVLELSDCDDVAPPGSLWLQHLAFEEHMFDGLFLLVTCTTGHLCDHCVVSHPIC